MCGREKRICTIDRHTHSASWRWRVDLCYVHSFRAFVTVSLLIERFEMPVYYYYYYLLDTISQFSLRHALSRVQEAAFVNQSINQSIYQSVSQSVNQPTNQTINVFNSSP